MRYLLRGGMKRKSGAESVAQSGPFGACPSWSYYTLEMNLISCQSTGGLKSLKRPTEDEPGRTSRREAG